MRLIGIVVALAAVVLVPAASAKEITKATACGTDGCTTTRDPAVLRGLMNGGPSTVPPKMHGGVIRVRATITAEGEAVGRSTSWWMPAARLLVAEDGTWMRLPARSERSMQRLTRGLTPFAASAIGISTTEPTPAPTSTAGHRSSDGETGISWLLLALPIGVAAGGAAALLARRRDQPGADAATP